MPGVSKERLNVKVEGDTLTIDGIAEIPCRRRWSRSMRTCGQPTIRRSFTLSPEMDVDKVEATLKDGVLTPMSLT